MNMCVHLCQEAGGVQGGSVVQLDTIKTAHVFCFLHVFSFPIMLQPKKKHILLMVDDGEQRGGG